MKLFNKIKKISNLKYFCICSLFILLVLIFLWISLWVIYSFQPNLYLKWVLTIILIFVILFFILNIPLLWLLINLNKYYDKKFNDLKTKEEKMFLKSKFEDKLKVNTLFNSLIKGIPLPILIINNEKDIISQNDNFLKIFVSDEKNKQSKKPLENIFWNDDFYKFVDNLILLETKNNNTVIEINKKFFKIIALKFDNANNKEIAYILIFEDITKIQAVYKREKEFISNITHELKTPISAVLLAVETILENKQSKEINDELEIIYRQNKQMNQIVSDLLKLISPLNESVLLNIEKCSIKNILSTSIVSLKHLWSAKNIKVLVNGNDIIIEADFHKLVQVFTNLIKNAIFYSKKNKNIECNIYSHENNLIVTVKDYGQGIELEHLNKIFDRFYCVNKDRSRKSGGSGLGLAIATELVELHKGSISVDSIFKQWTEFKVSLPK